MRTRIFFLIAAWVMYRYWLPCDAGVLSNDILTTRYHGKKVHVATSQGVELPITLSLLTAQGRRLRVSHDESDVEVKRRTFWKPNNGGPLPVDAIRGRYKDGELNGLGQSHKAMRYG